MSTGKEKIVLIGGGGHAHSVVDAIERMGQYEIAGFIDQEPTTSYKEYTTIGSDDDLDAIFKSGITLAAVTVGYLGKSRLRETLFSRAKSLGFAFPPIIDPSAVVANDAIIEEGSFIGKLAVVNSNTNIGAMTIVNSGAVIEHDCCLGDFSHVAVNATLCGNVQAGKFTFVGANAVVIQGVTLGDSALVGAGAVVLGDVKENQKVVGIYG